MDEANHSVHHAKVRARMSVAVMVLARQAAIKATKHRLRAQGVKPMYMPRREIIAAAEAYLDQHREELIAEAKPVVEQWRKEGFFGRRFANITTDAHGGNA